jgi:hypothetical protein
VLLSTLGLPGRQIAERVGCTEPMVVLWRKRYATEGLAGLDERTRRPPPRTAVTDEVREEILIQNGRLNLGLQVMWGAAQITHAYSIAFYNDRRAYFSHSTIPPYFPAWTTTYSHGFLDKSV